MTKTYPRAVVTYRWGRWWWRIGRSPALVEEACPHTIDTAAEAADQALDRMAYLADPLGHMVRKLRGQLRYAAMPRIFEAWEKANRARRSDYVLAGPAGGPNA